MYMYEATDKIYLLILSGIAVCEYEYVWSLCIIVENLKLCNTDTVKIYLYALSR